MHYLTAVRMAMVREINDNMGWWECKLTWAEATWGLTWKVMGPLTTPQFHHWAIATEMKSVLKTHENACLLQHWSQWPRNRSSLSSRKCGT